MKKVLVLLVISLTMISAIAMADSIGPTFEGGKLTFNTGNQVQHFYNSNFYMAQGFLATATAYEATLTNTSEKFLLDSFYSNYGISNKNSVVLASLNVESDATSVIGVSVVVPDTSTSDAMDLSYDYLNESNGVIYSVKTNNPPATLTLPFNSTTNGHSGYLYVTSNSTAAQLSEAEKSGLMFTFVIAPINYY